MAINKFKVRKRLSGYAKSKLRDGEVVTVIRRGDDIAFTNQPKNHNDLYLKSDNGWEGWMTLGKDIELSVTQDSLF